MTPDDSLADWLSALAVLGVTHDADCPFLLWAASVTPDRPVAELLAEAPPARRLEAALRVLESAPPDWPRAWWREIVLHSEASEAVKRWARKQAGLQPVHASGPGSDIDARTSAGTSSRPDADPDAGPDALPVIPPRKDPRHG